MKFGIFRKKGHQLKYIGRKITHTPGILHAIMSEVLKRLCKSHPPNTQICVPKDRPTMKILSARRALHLLFTLIWDIYEMIWTRKKRAVTQRMTQIQTKIKHKYLFLHHIFTLIIHIYP